MINCLATVNRCQKVSLTVSGVWADVVHTQKEDSQKTQVTPGVQIPALEWNNYLGHRYTNTGRSRFRYQETGAETLDMRHWDYIGHETLGLIEK